MPATVRPAAIGGIRVEALDAESAVRRVKALVGSA
jgi:hypothetical protein